MSKDNKIKSNLVTYLLPTYNENNMLAYEKRTIKVVGCRYYASVKIEFSAKLLFIMCERLGTLLTYLLQMIVSTTYNSDGNFYTCENLHSLSSVEFRWTNLEPTLVK